MDIFLSDAKEKSLPLVPIRDGVVFPTTEAVLTFGRPRSLAAIEHAFSRDRLLVIVMQKDPRINEPGISDLYQIATLAKIDRMLKTDREVNTLVRGISRVKINSYESVDPFFMARIVELPDEPFEESEEITALVNHITNELRRAVSLGKNIDFLAFMNIMSGGSPASLANQVASVLNIKSEQKQQLLEETNVKKRLEKIVDYLAHEVKVLEIEKKIVSKTQKKFSKSMRDSVLRERLKTIEKELGEDSESREIREMKKKIKEAKMPKEVEKKALKELKRLSQMSNYNPEASYLRTYLEWLIDLPWSKFSKNDVDIKKAAKILDEDHYGLKKVKERILEYLAVMKLRTLRAQAEKQSEEKISADSDQQEKKIETFSERKKSSSGKKGNSSSDADDDGEESRKGHVPTILCFVGPPGVGKTSLGRSIARAMGRKFVKMSLGGIRDEAEIRGHRRTYVGALPGRIIQGIKQAGTKNPVFMLDEIDKVGTDFRGDPSAALLEALDPEQNYAFSDHYLEVPFDLSKVFFITTCNVLDTIPPALRDRLEIIHFPGYTTDEKFHIAKDFLINKQLEAHGLTEEQVVITDPALKRIIQHYTREAGVRNLERQIATIYRKVARKIAQGRKKKTVVGVSDLPKFLGPYRFTSHLAEQKDEIGMATGLAWTEAGGDILFIEVALMPGKGMLTLTGQLGDVMKESCQAAMSYVRSRWQTLNLPKKFYQSLDVHVHVPEGAVPKDGPSAGIAIATALISALTKVPVRRDVGLTGEMTLRGRVLEIGGVKEKVIAAHRAKLKLIIMPKENKKDLEDIPKKIIKDLNFKFVSHMDEVLDIALVKPLREKMKKKKDQKEEDLEPLTMPRPLTARLPS